MERENELRDKIGCASVAGKIAVLDHCIGNLAAKSQIVSNDAKRKCNR
jgi:hypothetical protein